MKSNLSWPLHIMEIGDSFFVPGKYIKRNVYSNLSHAAVRAKIVLRIKKVEGGIRVWKIGERKGYKQFDFKIEKNIPVPSAIGYSFGTILAQVIAQLDNGAEFVEYKNKGQLGYLRTLLAKFNQETGNSLCLKVKDSKLIICRAPAGKGQGQVRSNNKVNPYFTQLLKDGKITFVGDRKTVAKVRNNLHSLAYSHKLKLRCKTVRGVLFVALGPEPPVIDLKIIPTPALKVNYRVPKPKLIWSSPNGSKLKLPERPQCSSSAPE
jgi:hypothetical protein